MVKYRRYCIPGAIYFFTVTLQDRKTNYLIQYIQQLGEAMRHIKRIHPFKTIAMVVLPDHLHAMWQLPQGDANFSLRWRCIKTAFAANIKKCGIQINKINTMKIYYGNDDFGSIRFVTKKIIKTMLHRLVERVSDWPYSTFHRYVKEGNLPWNWSYQGNDLYEE